MLGIYNFMQGNTNESIACEWVTGMDRRRIFSI